MRGCLTSFCGSALFVLRWGGPRGIAALATIGAVAAAAPTVAYRRCTAWCAKLGACMTVTYRVRAPALSIDRGPCPKQPLV